MIVEGLGEEFVKFVPLDTPWWDGKGILYKHSSCFMFLFGGTKLVQIKLVPATPLPTNILTLLTLTISPINLYGYQRRHELQYIY